LIRYLLTEEPEHELAEAHHPLSGYYRLTFRSPAGEVVRRLCTDKGRAEVLRRTDAGQRTFTWQEVRDLSVSDDPWRLLRRTIAESGEGA
jgi:hypothetical protein